MALRTSSSNSGTNDLVSVPVPAGVVANDIIILVVGTDSNNVPTGHYPSGFAELAAHFLIGPDGQAAAVAWKRASGADTGSYTFGTFISGAQDWVCEAFAFSVRDTTNPPTISTLGSSTASNGSPVTATANGVTAVAGDDLLWFVAPDLNTSGKQGTFTAPAGYTKQQDVHTATLSWAAGATNENVSAGATGTVSGSFTLTGGGAGWMAWLVRIPVAATAASFVADNRRVRSNSLLRR